MGSPPATITAALLAVSIALVPAACGDEEEPATTDPTATATEDCEQVPPAEPSEVKLKPPSRKVEPGERIGATVETNCGSFEIALDTKGSPKTASSFVHLVDEGAYDGTPFHRVVDGFVIQGGDPAADGTGGPGYSVVEPPPPDAAYTQGTVAMAKTSAEPDGTSGSQFFVVTAADAGLPPQYAILGEVSDGFRTVERIEALADPDLGQAGGEPVIPVVIDRIALS
jgi:peptidyl-prolyl cis-trans isomerase B (cyclophilin B)